MSMIIKTIFSRRIILAIFMILMLSTFFCACKERERGFTVGIINDATANEVIIDGFKTGMTEFGYSEGQNIRYIYSGIIGSSDEVIDAEIMKMASQKVDLIVTSGPATIRRVKGALGEKSIPIITCAGGELVENGIVESLSHPGDNITGVQLVDSGSKGLEWMVQAIPSLKKIYMPYNPDETFSTFYIEKLKSTAAQMGIALELHAVHSVEEVLADIENMPGDIDAIYMNPSPSLDSRNSELSRAAIRKAIPMGSAVPLDETVLISLTSDLYNTGKAAAYLAHQIHQGIKPADLPFKISDVLLTINLKTAKEIGIYIPDDVLAQAAEIIR